MHKTAIIIISWNNTTTLLNCINSIPEGYEIIIVDNASDTEEKQKLTENIPKKMHLILNNKNLGFAVANNQGIKYAAERLKPEYIMLLNHDTIVTPDSIKILLDLMEKNPSIGAVQPKLLRIDDKSVIDSAGQIMYSDGSVRDRGIGKKDSPLYNGCKEVFGACAAAVLYRTSALLETGFFDERLFILFEDVDISWRLRLKGYKIFYQPQAIIYHERGISKPGSKKRDLRILQELYGFRNCLAITLKYYPLYHIIWFIPVHIYRLLMWFFLRIRHKINVKFLKHIFSALWERKNIQKFSLIKEIQQRWIIKISYKDILNIRKNENSAYLQ